ncbi:hypothetical protein SESBI_33647 [Sesbania bispinosa]|nr:hypothetical protein SESBI_33647 [Sesbania bispinosa]
MSQRTETELKHIVFGIALHQTYGTLEKNTSRYGGGLDKQEGLCGWIKVLGLEEMKGTRDSNIRGHFKIQIYKSSGAKISIEISRVVTETLKLG